MKILFITLTWLSLIGSSVEGLCQEFYTSQPLSLVHGAIPKGDWHFSDLNPALRTTKESRAGAYGVRHLRTTNLLANDDQKTETKAESKEEMYGLGAVGDLGAGMLAGLQCERVFTESKTTRSTSVTTAKDLMQQQAINGIVAIEIATGVRLGFLMRYVSLTADLAGGFNTGEIYRVRYHGNLLGHGGGIYGNYGDFSGGMTYYPAIKGKSEIMFEERIVADPGLATADAAYRIGKHLVGASLIRWIHKRDERVATVTSVDGQRTLTLNGSDPEKNVFPILAYHVGLEFNLNGPVSLLAGISRKDSVYTTDIVATPISTEGFDAMTEQDLQAGIRYIHGTHDVFVGAYKFARSLTLTESSSQRGTSYEASGLSMMASWGAKL
jgi:hypothetical protein